MPKRKPPGIFTPRQIELLILFSKDYSYKMAAVKLGISFETVKSHMEAMRDHFGLHTESALLGFAIKTLQILPEDL